MRVCLFALGVLALSLLVGCQPAEQGTDPAAKPATSKEGGQTGSGSDLKVNPNYGG